MEQMTVKEILEAVGGRLLCGREDLPLCHISIDSRVMAGDDLFVPLIGEKADAHDFIGKAFEAGAAAVLTSRHDAMEDTHPWIRVEDTKKALQDIGAYYRNRLRLPVIGVTGSVGKTTTRGMIAAALSAKYRVFQTPKNYNGQIGVPVALSEISAKDEICVLELGMSMPGEMTVIAGIARADMAVITNIGVSHIENLGSQERICQEKLAIQDGMKENGILFLNGDDPFLKNVTAKKGCRTVYYGTHDGCRYRAEDIRMEDGYPVFTAVCGDTRIPMRLSVMGRHNVLNAMAALAVADACRTPLARAAEALEAFTGQKGRQQIVERGGITVIDDTYNASPASMIAGLEVLHSVGRGRRRIAVLADMKELGPEGPRFHQEIGSWLGEHPVDILFTLGDLAGEIADTAKRCGGSHSYFHFSEEERESLEERLKELVRPGDCILLKGSNSMRLGEIAARLLQRISKPDMRGISESDVHGISEPDVHGISGPDKG